MKKIRVWDLPVRLFHWTLVVLITISLITQKIGGNAMEWHFLSGYAVLTLIFFRIVWGLVGTRYARFSDFIPSPAVIMAYLKQGKGAVQRTSLGHNPLGSLAVFAMLGVILLQAATGLFANDDIASEGPLVKFISKELSDRITWFHKDVTGWLIFILIGVHVAAIAFYYFGKKENLVKPMITGDKEIDIDAPVADDSWKMRLVAVLVLAVCAVAVYGLINLKP
ncbi:MAG: cytochrome b/b6 domain-containing protein [Pseudomonadota bacterium]